ncbi:MAG: hypothetical protein J0I12_19620 [Candidatus Eremiobacteraeota bacterium]|nr:hypothetical protein [Candidatus Eremiobacteraeota bacterium]
MATETQTETGHLLVFTIKAVLEKRASKEQLAQVLESSRKGLDEQVNDFQGTIQEMAPEMREKVATLVQGAEEVFGFLEAALGDIASYLENNDENLLYSAGSVVRRGTEQLNFIFDELRNFVLAVSGPTSIPNLNLMIRAHEVFVPEKDANGERLKEFCHAERIMALQSLDSLGSSEQTPELAALKDVWDSHLRCMNRMFAAIEKGDKASVNKEMENAKISFARLNERIPGAVLSQRIDGPTPSEQVNLALSFSKDVGAQSLGDGPLVEVLAGIHTSSEELSAGLDQMLEAGVESVMLREAMDRALQACDYQQEALADFAEFFTTRLDVTLRSARRKLEESTIQLSAALDNLSELSEREGKVACMRCGHFNPGGRNNCEKCNMPLPNLGQSAGSTFDHSEENVGTPAIDPEQPVLTGNLVRLYTAVNQIFDGSIDGDKFLSEVEWFQGVIDKNSEYEIEEPNWEALSEEERAQEEVGFKAMEEAQELFGTGVTEMNEALERMRGYLESEAREDLEEALRMMDAGARKVAAVGNAAKQKRK